ncbi:hypothetical protein COCNU_07G007760 [Cocos nucifera]|uniref:Uncharacterized protein n=1 Tax=Cocos nucifera TaxID=13894 RepID=A0A8K0N5E8_COCNU|nr:hypothetical protein COCNU_07G007760 [Cocos nucifera]
MKMVSEAKKAADEEVCMMKEKMNAMEQKYTEMQTQMTMMIARMEAMHKRFLDEQLSDNAAAPSEPLGSRQAPDTSSTQEALQQLQAHSLLASHADPSDEKLDYIVCPSYIWTWGFENTVTITMRNDQPRGERLAGCLGQGNLMNAKMPAILRQNEFFWAMEYRNETQISVKVPVTICSKTTGDVTGATCCLTF